MHQEIDKVADLAKNAAAALLAIVHPMVGGERSRVDPIMQREGLGDGGKKRLHPSGHGSEAAIEANHQGRALRNIDSEIGGGNRAQFFF